MIQSVNWGPLPTLQFYYFVDYPYHLPHFTIWAPLPIFHIRDFTVLSPLPIFPFFTRIWGPTGLTILLLYAPSGITIFRAYHL